MNRTKRREALALYGGVPAVKPGIACRWPLLTDMDTAAVRSVLDRGVLSGQGAPEMRLLEKEFAAFLGASCCLATNSGTAALYISLAAANVGVGDEVILPALSFIATAQAVLQRGAVPVFVDVDAGTFNMDPALIEDRLSLRTRAIIPVHLHGLPADMDEVNRVAQARGLAVIEDAAQAHGASYRGRPVGRLGAMAAFSLNSTKNLPAGEGGLFVTDSLELGQQAARVRFNGLEPNREWDPHRPLDPLADSLSVAVGGMFLPGEMTCALARSQLQRLVTTTARSQANAALLTQRLEELPGIETPVVPEDRTHVFHKYRIKLDSHALSFRGSDEELRDRVIEALRAEGVEVSVWQTRPLPRHPVLRQETVCPRAQAVLDASFIIGSQSYPLFAQPTSVVNGWADAFEKVWANLPEFFS